MAEEFALADIEDIPASTVQRASAALHRAMDLAGFEHTLEFRFYAKADEAYRATATDWRRRDETGLIYPAILCGQALPDGLSEDELTAVFLHELHHLRRHFDGPLPAPRSSDGVAETQEQKHAEEFAADEAAARWMGDAMPMMRAIAILNIAMEVPLNEPAESHPAPLERVGRLMRLQRELGPAHTTSSASVPVQPSRQTDAGGIGR